MQISMLSPSQIPAAAQRFGEGLRRLQAQVPELPTTLLDGRALTPRLEKLAGTHTALAAYDEWGELEGYLGWYYVENFRDTGCKAAFVPDWAHAARAEQAGPVYRALYRQAAAQWEQAGCQVHALTLLSSEAEAIQTWFWSGFGMTVVDALRSTRPLNCRPAVGFSLRRAVPDDGEILHTLEAEHCLHYSASPVFMPVRAANSPQEMAALLENPENSIWLACRGDTPAAYLQLEVSSFGSAAVIQAEDSIAITGAYTRPAYRGQKLAASLLDRALQHYADQGYTRCSVDFESLNPEATAFWMRYFKPVCYSLVRFPENMAQKLTQFASFAT